MIRNFFKTATRNITRHKAFSFINITGLTLGLTACLLIGLFVWDEKQYDKFVPGGEQVYRIYTEYTNTNGVQNMAAAPPAFATTLQRDFPEIEKTARVMMQAENKTLFENGKTKLYEESGFVADSTFFEVFPVAFKYGSGKNVFLNPNDIVLSDELAQRLFGSENPVGKQLLISKFPYRVTGVFVKNPKFHLQFNYMISLGAITDYIPAERMESWGWHQFFNYAKLKKGTDVNALQAKFQRLVKEKGKQATQEANTFDKPFFQPLKNIHLYSSDFKFDKALRGNITYVNALIIIAAFILLIACFNFINLATAKSLQRAKEVGIRKTVGADKKQLVLQFTGETVFLAFISIVISVVVAVLVLPIVNNFTNKDIPITLLGNPFVVIFFLLLALVTGLIAGFYPAIVLAGFRPVKVLKASSGNQEPGKEPWLRHSLVVVQFTLSALLIICALVVFTQVNYLRNKDLGFNKEQIMFFPMRGDSLFNNTETFKNELLKAPGVSSVSIGYGFPGDAVAGDQIISERNGKRVSHSATQLAVDYDYVKTLGLQIIAGRDFSKSMGTDKDHAWIINETAVQALGFGTAEKALGKNLYWHVWNAPNPDSLKNGQVIGVVKDFNYKSLYDKIEPAVLQIFPGAAWKVAIKINTANTSNTIDKINSVWTRFTPDYPLEYKFLDDNFEQLYNSEEKLRSLLWIFTSIAIFVGCLGLFGLAAYTAERRKKEIGVRKVLGASTKGIVLLLSKDFLKLVIISLLVASPVAWYFMNKWLQDFAYRINIGWWVFAIAGLIAISIALVTVSFQAIRAAVANPVKSLRTE